MPLLLTRILLCLFPSLTVLNPLRDLSLDFRLFEFRFKGPHLSRQRFNSCSPGVASLRATLGNLQGQMRCGSNATKFKALEKHRHVYSIVALLPQCNFFSNNSQGSSQARNTWATVVKSLPRHIRDNCRSQNEVGVVDSHNRLIQYRMLGVGKGAEIGATVLIELNGQAYVLKFRLIQGLF